MTRSAAASATLLKSRPGGRALQAISLIAKPAAAGEPAIACTLSAGSMKGRIGDWQSLLAHVERRERIDGGVRCVFAASVPNAELIRSGRRRAGLLPVLPVRHHRRHPRRRPRGACPRGRTVDRRVDVRRCRVSAKKENATIVGVGVAACAVCCAGPILGVLAAIGLGTAAGLRAVRRRRHPRRCRDHSVRRHPPAPEPRREDRGDPGCRS